MATMNVVVDGVTYEVAPLDPPQSDKPQVGFMAITPQTAERWLKFNRSNRSLRARAYTAQTRDMLNGNWDINGESLKISRPVNEGEIEELPKGNVMFLDGQHRLEACVESGKPFVTVVVWGLEPATRNTVDTGITRTMADVLKMGREANAPVVASILRRYKLWQNGDYKGKGQTKPTHAELLDLLEQERDAVLNAADKGYWVRTGFRDLSPSIVGFAYLLCSKVSAQDAPWFFSRLRDGAELPAMSPVLALRNRLSRERQNGRVVPEHQLAIILKGWNYYREDRTTDKIMQALDDPMPMPK